MFKTFYSNMNFEGDWSVIELMKKRSAGDYSDNAKLLLIIDGGLMKCSYGVGAALAIEEAGFSEVFDDAVGISGGAPTVGYLLAKDMIIGSTVMYDECTTREFMNFYRPHKLTDVTFIDGVFRGKTGKKINAEAILSQKTNFYLSITKHSDASPKLVKPANPENLYVTIKASCAMPGVCGEVVEIDGVNYVDGAFSSPHAVKCAVDLLKPTHVLWITNQEKSEVSVSIFEKFLYQTIYRNRISLALLKSSFTRRKLRHQTINELEGQTDINLAVIWGDMTISSIERSSEVVKQTIERSRLWWHEILAK